MSFALYAEIFDVYRKIEGVRSPLLNKEGQILPKERERLYKLKELESIFAAIIRSPEDFGL
ncbi:hypothetical protein M2128_001447 [Polynucleobacter sphagniphilus]|uniref:hypothetical protein n=1 Tax=Polynucleobacter TaxID=44013 RepID=UPI0008F85D7D|nr:MULTISPECIES: hypothetical protein [Polynucleobacter]MDH6302523.1 hypothetical protein [Polynucleobacter sphagniphilus]OIM98998.1 hypothetical protein A9236_09460 [Polynucleobacter sp. QLW-P1DATA-2]OIN02202.1 hypothetical protein A9235_00370 [Polynucleobacter sp. MWH-Tro8-2-5-gr]